MLKSISKLNLISLLVLALLNACSLTPASPEIVKDLEASKVYGQAPYDQMRAPSEALNYSLEGNCDGFPRIKGIKTAPGLCVGLVDNNEEGTAAMRLPRAIAAYKDDLIVADMAGWQQTRGQVFLFKKKKNGHYKRFLLLDAEELPKDKQRILYMPSLVQVGPDGLVWIGSASTIFRFDPRVELFDGEDNNSVGAFKQTNLRRRVRNSIDIVLDHLPYKSWNNSARDSLHPLKAFIFDRQGKSLYLGIGASTDNCERAAPNDCPEAEAPFNGKISAYATIYRYSLDQKSRPVGNPVLIARGVRNSLALAFDPSTGVLYQGENSRGVRGANHLSRVIPPDELNVIEAGNHYGWPYCSGFSKLEPEFQTAQRNCSKYREPLLLLPPHGAPLQMMFYTGSKLPAWYKGRLLIALHGHEEFGHRIISFARDDQGRPTGAPLDIVYGWEGEQVPLGRPMGITQASDGSVFITEDKTRRLLRLSVDGSQQNNTIAITPQPSARDVEWIEYLKNNP